jgi:hypothetical protein
VTLEKGGAEDAVIKDESEVSKLLKMLKGE